MKCPECGAKIGQKNYDAAFEWYECPKCEGAFTGDEIMEAELSGTSSARGSDRSVDSGNSRNSNRGSNRNGSTGKPKAKAKKKQEQIDADEAAIAEYEKRTTETIVVTEKSTKHRDEVSIGQVVQLFADEIELVYEETGQEISRDNAVDKALTLWRNLHYHDGIVAREKSMDVALCGDHS